MRKVATTGARGAILGEDVPPALFVYRAYPALFDTSGTPHVTTPEVLLGSGNAPPEVPALTDYRWLGYDVTECQLDAVDGYRCPDIGWRENDLVCGFNESCSEVRWLLQCPTHPRLFQPGIGDTLNKIALKDDENR